VMTLDATACRRQEVVPPSTVVTDEERGFP
jgi:hypothetical protein